MKTLYISLIISCIALSTVQAQKKQLFLVGELEGGILNSKYSSVVVNAYANNLINKERYNAAIKASIAVMLDINKHISAEIGVSQTAKYWNLEGQKTNNNVIIKQRLFYPSVFVGGWYNINLLQNKTKLQLYLGSRFSADFINYDALTDRDGTTTNYVVSVTEKSEAVIFNAIPEIGVKGHFKNGDQWLFGIKYYYPINGDNIIGNARHFTNSGLSESIDYEASGQVFAASFRYKFKLSKK